ncbi:hypothetical protein COY62_03665 [bacterium (Candidatus Howlettbacteria) CG_4_10_14_0_8_um_filter_40_9]|nr:MAG: hypothetical protein COY62_03665 [bacterium (Candidatus Howlettbacteria) CG_4_10_14_0_8_um_filter_40_9]
MIIIFFLRWAVTSIAAFSAFKAFESVNEKWSWVMGAIAILFNTIIPIHMSKEIWIVIDFTTALLFVSNIFVLRGGFKNERGAK